MDNPTDTPTPGPLNERERTMLEFEREWWMSATPKDVAVRERFLLTIGEYEQQLDELIDRDDALEFDELGVRRLRRRRERRRRDHDARRVAEGEAR